MAPVGNITRDDCLKYFPFSYTTESFNVTSSNISTNSTAEIAESELQALLYIVVTLLFYSLGIIIGIVTYLKREKQEMEEDKLYDEFLYNQYDVFANSRLKKVQQVIRTLEFLQTRQLTKSDLKDKLINSDSKEHARRNSKCEMASNSKSLSFVCDKDDNTCEDDDLDEPLSALVAKLIDPEKRKSTGDNSDPGGSTHTPGTSSREKSNPGSPKKEGELHESSSMQSLKDYAEEPRRNERSSLSSEEDVTSEESEKSNVDVKDKNDSKKGNFDVTKVISGSCVVTNV